MMRIFTLIVLSLFAALFVRNFGGHSGFADPQQVAHYRHHGAALLNDLTVTPGAVRAGVTAAQLCDPKFHTGTIRDVTESEKVQVCARALLLVVTLVGYWASSKAIGADSEMTGEAMVAAATFMSQFCPADDRLNVSTLVSVWLVLLDDP